MGHLHFQGYHALLRGYLRIAIFIWQNCKMSFANLQQRLSSLLVLRCVCVCLGPLVGAAWGAWGPRGVGRTATTRAYGTLGTERKGKEILTSASINCAPTLLQQKTGSDLGPRTEVKVRVWNQDYYHPQASPSGRGGREGEGGGGGGRGGTRNQDYLVFTARQKLTYLEK